MTESLNRVAPPTPTNETDVLTENRGQTQPSLTSSDARVRMPETRIEWGCWYADWDDRIHAASDRDFAQGWVDFARTRGHRAYLVSRLITTGPWTEGRTA